MTKPLFTQEELNQLLQDAGKDLAQGFPEQSPCPPQTGPKKLAHMNRAEAHKILDSALSYELLRSPSQKDIEKMLEGEQ